MMFLAALLAGCAGQESAKDTGGTAQSGGPAVTGRTGDTASPSAVTGITNGGEARDTTGLVRALIVGTSLTAGLGLDPDSAYPALLQRMADSAGLPVQIVNAGLSGETSAGALRRIDWLLQRPVELVLLETGANDGLRGLDIDTTEANLRRIIERVRDRQPAARILLAQMEAPPNLGEAYTTRFREMFPTVAREEGAGLVPFLLEGVAAIPAMNQGDGIHPNTRGARRVAQNVWRTLGPELERLVRQR